MDAIFPLFYTEKWYKLKLSAISSEVQFLAQVATRSHDFIWTQLFRLWLFLLKMIKEVYIFIHSISTCYKPAIPVLTLCKLWSLLSYQEMYVKTSDS